MRMTVAILVLTMAAGRRVRTADRPDVFWLDLPVREAFDVTLFVNNTTAARPNPLR